ncbi:MAG: hypothetical protein WAV00_04505 [Nocardioides sp.]
MGSRTATFTKWLVGEGPEMVGVAGGVVGDGAYSGRVLELIPGDPTTVVRAVYRLAGPEHDFTVLMYVEQTGLIATLSGVITDGWCKGSLVRGEYTEIQYEHDGITTDAWQGTIDIVEAPVESQAGSVVQPA